ncbi:DUF6259 domain-containing protein [Microbacterium kyungheense]|uniref:DUF6259 domain-containing protein n=1 Tax=Microbacterium kyungheense TaxID=1263636 RepID=A0A543EAI4_9MICO|nr:DUF6259 domain-containing protein [Microbacterium kyungheense]TQM18604.1 hypothetical protein FB391_3735 [Microbacterium kyungheense]
MPRSITIADDRISVAFDADTGGIVAVSQEGVGPWLRSPAGGSLFVFEVPRHGDRTVVVETAGQTLSASTVSPDGRTAQLTWDGLTTSTGERLGGRIEVRAAVENGALELTLRFAILDADVEAVRFPAIRGISPAHGALEYRGVDYSTGTRVRLLPVFDNNSPYWGTTFPDHASGNLRPEVIANPTSPFVVLAGDEAGLTVLPAAPTLEFIGWRTSLEPGYLDSLSRTTAPDATVTFEAIHFPTPAAQEGELPAMRVAPYRGEWTAGTDVYRATQGPTRRSRAAWLAEPRSWLQVQLMSTEGEPRYDFDALVDIIEECAATGIGAIQITGWNEGGQDGLVPVHRPSEKLGGLAGLRRALERARELDVKTVLYVKYVWVEKPGPYWAEFEASVARDPNGQPYAQPGPVYHSSRKRYGISTPWYVPLCFGVEAVRDRFAREVAELQSWGADGVLADESLYHGRSLMCFAEDHGHEPGASSFLWDGQFVEDLRRAIGEGADEFVIAAEGAYDEQFEHYDVSYFRSFSATHVPLGRMLRPDARIVTALIGSDDRNMVNQSLLYGYALSFEPFNFKGRPGDMPATVAYGTATDALRTELAQWLWSGSLTAGDGIDARVVDGDGDLRTAVWRDAAGTPCLVVANYAEEACTVAVTGLTEAVDVHRPDGAAASAPASRITLPARSAAVVK